MGAAAVLWTVGCTANEPTKGAGGDVAPLVVEASSRAREALSQVTGRLPSAIATRVQREGGWLSPEIESRVHVRFGAEGPGFFRIEQRETGLSVEVTPRGFGTTNAEFVNGWVVYPGIGPDGGDVFHRATEEGTEDYVVVKARPADAVIAYDVALGEQVAGLRLVDRTLEFLDVQGTPRLRVAPPYLLDARDRRIEAWIEVMGCQFDNDPRGPWGRAVVDPGARHCEVQVRWNGAEVEYPAVVDPAWMGTGAMVFARLNHTATLLQINRVLVAGGEADPNGSVIRSSAELYDVESGTFSATASMPAAHARHTATVLPTGDVLIAGGNTSEKGLVAASERAEIYSFITATWSTAPNMSAKRIRHTANLLPSGQVLVIGGQTAERFDGSSWQLAASPQVVRNGHAATVLQSGKVLVTGGQDPGSLYSVELYDPAANTWTTVASLQYGRYDHYSTLLLSGKVLVTGGPHREIYNPATNSWSITTGTNNPLGMAAISLPNGTFFTSGGDNGYGAVGSADIYEEDKGWQYFVEPMVIPRAYHALTMIPSINKILATGGFTSPAVYTKNMTDTAELLGFQSKGGGCTASAECGSLFCVDQVCCDSPCDGSCDACSVASGAAVNGVCSPVAAGNTGSPACGNFLCTGQSGECPTKCTSHASCIESHYCDTVTGDCVPGLPAGQACAFAAQCKSGFCVDGVCCNSECAGTCQACSAATKASGSGDGVCGDAKAGSDPHDSCPDEGSESCLRDGQCDGLGACRLHAAGISCAAPTCANNAPVFAACDGAGTCVPTSQPNCGTHTCKSGACLSACSATSDCTAMAYCENNDCVPRSGLGESCERAEQCTSNLCVDGVCCNAPCQGSCESCVEPGSAGICMPVMGAPRPGHSACPPAESDDPCAVRVCDGTERKTCAAFVGTNIVCRAASCEDGSSILETRCDGSGACPPPKPKACEPFVCGVSACATECSSDAGCAKGYRCETATGQCISTPICEGTRVIQGGVPGFVECAPYGCADGACKQSCQSVEDCAAPHACNLRGKCVMPPGEADTFGSCAMNTRSTTDGKWAMMLAAMAALAAMRQARKNAKENFR